MSQPYNRVYNFSAGPGTLPVAVLEQARDEMLNWHGTGMGVMEMSHRAKPFESILAQTISDLRELLALPDNYKILFLQGGASLQFSNVPANFLNEGQTGAYIVTGSWGKKAVEGGKAAGSATVTFDGKAGGYKDVPQASDLSVPDNAAYVHFTSNETIEGVEFPTELSFASEAPVICDMSSNILSRPTDISQYGLIYAGAQKNMGPSGVTLVIIRNDLLEKVKPGLPPMLDYRIHADNNSMYNTPPTFGIYICGLVYKHLLNLGGLSEVQKLNQAKAGVLYQAIDQSGGFYKGHAIARSNMNVTFTLPSEDLTKLFVKESEAAGLDGLKGHRSVGGIRASIYNAFPAEGTAALAEFMTEFAKKNG